MKKIILLITIVGGIWFSPAQTLTSPGIWYEVIPAKINTDSLLTKKGFILKYSGPKKQGGNLACYFHKKADEWLFIHTNEKQQTTQVSYLLPSLKKFLKNWVDKKQLLPGEEVVDMGKTFQENRTYYHLIYKFERPELPISRQSP
ncbi:MAG: hypothetical protein LBE92_07215 [Chryseobacterium sp.]|jgi:hypothetical protein|uniref:hypothetical protein n=1 Tax=Chryseobacterium sp. TaxID=1871047 RepID=UPI00281BA7A6|nr:hypothetical protein [Chryseobacterium sp.]MDR2235897.1 hypothetical protein [Chryseobacterium sp.]